MLCVALNPSDGSNTEVHTWAGMMMASNNGSTSQQSATTSLGGSQQPQLYPVTDSVQDEQAESRENPTGLAKILSRARRTSSHSRSPNRSAAASTLDNQSTTSSSPSFFSRMTGSTATPHEHAHGHGPISALKGVFANRPSSRDRRAGGAREEGMERVASSQPDSERGRDFKVSTGRGGAGNIRASSQSRARDDPDSGEEEARERSRERSRDRGHGSGRGGAGNFRSASKNPDDRFKEKAILEEDAELEKAAHERRLAEEAKTKHQHSYGRGGAGNIK